MITIHNPRWKLVQRNVRLIEEDQDPDSEAIGDLYYMKADRDQWVLLTRCGLSIWLIQPFIIESVL